MQRVPEPGSVTSRPRAQGTCGILLAVGGQITLQGYGGTVGTAGTVWANTGTVGLTGAVAAGMPSVASVV